MVRDSNGRYVKGQTGNPKGRPKAKREVEYYHVLMTYCTAEDWQAIVAKAVEQAKRGDSVARKFLADYLIGPPVEHKDVQGDLRVLVEYVSDSNENDTE